ncbi:MAG TPA: PAS domain S-box protein [Gemmatimonadaceae bacterium]|nr:PAS domain S-box protein [Gemmatimonadaceae bacterium]
MAPDGGNEASYRALIEQSPNAIVVQAAGTVLFANEAALRLVGATHASQMVGHSTVEFVHADSRAAAEDRRVDVEKSGDVRATTLLICRLDGSTIEVESMSSRVRFGEHDATQAVLRDVTDRFTLERERNARLRAEQHEAQFRQLAEAIPQIVWTATPDGSLDYYNKRWFDYTGQTLQDGAGWGWGPVVHPEDLQPCMDRWAHSCATGEPYEVEYRFKRASDGVYRWHLGRAMAMRDDAGAIVKWFGTCTDIDDQKRAVEALAESQSRIRSLLDQSPVSTAIFDADGRPVESNPAYAKLWGRPATAVAPGWTLFDDPVFASPQLGALVRRAFDGEHVTLPLLLYENGSTQRGEIWVRAILNPIRDAAGRVTQVVQVQEDVTARHEAEVAYHAARERFRIVQDASPDGFALLRSVRDDLDQVIDFEFLYSNPAGDRMIGGEARQPATRLVGRKLLDVFPELRGTPLIAGYLRVLDDGEPFRTEYQSGSENAPQWTAITVVRVDNDLAVTYSDVTVRRIAEQYLAEANERLELGVAERTAELQESEERYRTVLSASPDGIALQLADFSIAAWNEAGERITGLTKEQLAGRGALPAGWKAIREDGSRYPLTEHPSLLALRTGEVQTDCTMGISHPDGRVVWISVNTTPLIHPGETTPYAAVTSFADVTARREAAAALRESEQRFQLLAMQAPVGIFHSDAVGEYTFVNERFCELTGIRPEEALGQGWQTIVDPDDRERVVDSWRAATSAGHPFEMEYRMRSVAGVTLWVDGRAEGVRDAKGVVTGYIGSVHDLSDRKRAEEALRTLSLRDELTGLWNRRGFIALGEQECRRARRTRTTVLVMYGDVNAFKTINDAHGHRAGDEALIAVATALSASCRNADVAGRIGGDEFVVLSVHDTPDGADAGEAAIRARLDARLQAASVGRDYTLTLSLGAARGSGADVSLDALLASADDDLYVAKRQRQKKSMTLIGGVRQA